MSAPELSALFQQGFAHHQAGALPEAGAIYRQILAADSQHFDALHLLGVVHMQTGDVAEAGRLIAQAVAVNDAQAPAWINLAIVQAAQKDFAAALTSYDRAIALQPANAEAHYNRGNTLLEMGQADEALASFHHTLTLVPQHVAARVSRGVILRDAGQTEPALRDFEAAVQVAPDFTLAHYNHAQALKDLNRIAEAEDSFRRALALAPPFAEAHVGLAEVLFLGGKDTQAWPEYEWRWATPGMAAAKRNFTQPQWDGLAAIKDKTVLVYAEQGFGDAIQFARYALTLAAFGARVVFEVRPTLKPLFAGAPGLHAVVGMGDALPSFDMHIPLMSLPRLLKADNAAYLKADDAKVRHWQSVIGTKTGVRVGVAWAGRRTHRNDRNRSLAFYDLTPLMTVSADFFSLQKDVSESDAVNMNAQPRLKALGDDLHDFADTAAVIAQLDVVIAADTAVAHLAGAMGKPVWILLPFAPDWRWGLNRVDTPWYPSARLYRQERAGDWASVIARMADDLRQLPTESMSNDPR